MSILEEGEKEKCEKETPIAGEHIGRGGRKRREGSGLGVENSDVFHTNSGFFHNFYT